jgi:anti-anti-sigma regulatory factor
MSRRPSRSSNATRTTGALSSQQDTPPPPWGVRLERIGRAIVVAPSSVLDGDEVQRLRDMLESRQGAYDAVVIDLRDVVSVGADGLALLREQRAWAAERGLQLVVVTGPAAREALTRFGVAEELEIVDDIEAVLAPHRD